MKKVVIVMIISVVALVFLVSCKAKVEQAPPPPPQVEEQPAAEKVTEPPAVTEPQLTEEEIFMKKTLEEVNAEAPLDMIYFDFDKYFIREDAIPVLETNAAWLKKYQTVKILIEGHCDERGTEEYNLALGEKRAKSTMDYFISLGIPASRMSIVSYGKSQPIDYGHNETAWQKNRRAQFVIIAK